jgi:hypothetical protein
MSFAMQVPSVDEASLHEYERALRDYVEERPLTAVAAGFAAGYVLGGGLTLRLSWLVLTAVGRVTLINLLRDAALGRRATEQRM